MSAQGAANHLNDLGAEPAQGLFGKEVTAQDVAVGKPKEKLEWAPPAKPKGDDAKGQGELPGMKDAYAPGMFGRAKT
ncbi:hypothetical protein M3M33_14195, partial [Loigolactobacillus coryniformis]|nr:hypothetical protein [Loigolactobacillus coryniformis]